MKGLRLGLLVTFLSCMALPSWAQSVPDRSLGGESTRLVREGPIEYVEGGSVRGDALFHSFEDLRVGHGRGLYFRAGEVDRIFSQVTGDRQSRIDGTLGAIGDADLYLINPNGIVFGPDARLDIGGSFVASTASSFTFPDYEYGVDDWEDVPPLLTIRDWGLQVQSDAQIVVHGLGHTLTTRDDVLFNPLEGAGAGGVGLSLENAESVFLISRNIQFQDGILTVPSGSIQLLAIGEGMVEFDNRLGTRYLAEELGSIRLLGASLVDVSGLGSGSVDMVSNQISLAGGSLIVSQNLGAQESGDLAVTASLLTINGDGDQEIIDREIEGVSGFFSEAFIGRGSDINLDVNNLILDNGGSLSAKTYGPADSGNIEVLAEDITIIGESSLTRGDAPSNIQTATLAGGDSGQILIDADRIFLRGGGIINTNAFSPLSFSARSGDIRISSNQITIQGNSSSFLPSLPSGILSSSAFSGSSGDVFIDSGVIEIYRGGYIGSSTSSIGRSGNVELTVDRMIIDGSLRGADNLLRPGELEFADFTDRNNFNRSIVGSFFIPSDSTVQNPSSIVGESGNVVIDSDILEVRNNAVVATVNTSSGRSGNVVVDSGIVYLDQGGLSADLVTSGVGGNIVVDAETVLILNNSLVSASASGVSDGGNLAITSDIMIAEGSQLRADAQFGTGGRVTLNSDAFYQQNSEITATSDLSSTLDGLVDLDVNYVLNSGDLVFVAVYPGNLPSLYQRCFPTESRSSFRMNLRRMGETFDFHNLDSYWLPDLREEKELSVHDYRPAENLVEANSIERGSDGTIRLTNYYLNELSDEPNISSFC